MFALWYLSLALDELRKYLGWPSILDAFKSNKTAKALEDTPSASKPTPVAPTKVPEKLPEPVKPKPAVVEQPKAPIVEVKPEPPKPKVPEVKPEPPKPQVLEVKPELPKEIKPEAPKPVVVEAKPELPKPVIAEAKPELPKQVVPELPKPEAPKPTLTTINNNTIFPSPNGFEATPTAPANDVDRKFFAPPKAVQNGDSSDAQPNIKDATSSFLAGEGRASSAQARPGASSAVVVPLQTTHSIGLNAPANSRQAKWENDNPSMLRTPLSGALEQSKATKRASTTTTTEAKEKLSNQTFAERRARHEAQMAEQSLRMEQEASSLAAHKLRLAILRAEALLAEKSLP